MQYIQVGAYVNDERCPSKAALKRALKDAPETVKFDCTAAAGPHANRGPIKGTEVPKGDTLSVCGPDPYTNRKWYASVSIGRTGNIRVA